MPRVVIDPAVPDGESLDNETRPHPIALSSFLSKDTAGSSGTKSMSVA